MPRTASTLAAVACLMQVARTAASFAIIDTIENSLRENEASAAFRARARERVYREQRRHLLDAAAAEQKMPGGQQPEQLETDGELPPFDPKTWYRGNGGYDDQWQGYKVPMPTPHPVDCGPTQFQESSRAVFSACCDEAGAQCEKSLPLVCPLRCAVQFVQVRLAATFPGGLTVR